MPDETITVTPLNLFWSDNGLGAGTEIGRADVSNGMGVDPAYIDRVVLTVDSEHDYVKARVEWAGGAVRERSLPREVFGYKKQQQWKPLSCRLAALHGLGAFDRALQVDRPFPPEQA